MTFLKNIGQWARLWESVQIAKYSLGKYIIGFACLLHIFWAAMLAIDQRAGNATALSIFFRIYNNRFWVVVWLLFVSVCASIFINFRARKIFNLKALSFLLLPQQIALSCSAMAGIHATIVQHYADGVARSWAHIGTDQLPVILTAILYTVACLETRRLPFKSNGTS
jgi:hypothetical protein